LILKYVTNKPYVSPNTIRLIKYKTYISRFILSDDDVMVISKVIITADISLIIVKKSTIPFEIFLILKTHTIILPIESEQKNMAKLNRLSSSGFD